MLSLDNWLSWGEAEWYVWLQQQTDTRRKVFTADIDEMIASYNRERNSARDYHGRELLELLQNADDAGAENEKKNRVLIELTDKALYVANTGLPFSPAGVKSLMVSDNSPKQLSRTRYIGYKGLGFRSILGWASEIAILSGDLSIGFIEKEAIKAGTSIYEMDEKATASVQNFLAKTGYLPIPTLAFPIPLEDSSALSHEFKTILERSVDYKKDGYDTVISFLLKDPNKTETAVESQIQSFGKEILLFSNYIEKAEFRSPTKKVIWDAAREGNKITVGSGTEAPSRWQVFERHGDVPPEYIGPGQPK
jgi:hypothetical protein